MICEVCNQPIEVEVSHGSWLQLQKVDSIAGYSFFQCEQGQVYNFAQWEHFCCCHEHMQTMLITCLNTHYDESFLHPIPVGMGTTILHRVVLGSNLACKVCSTPLATVAYRFNVTQGTPLHRVPDSSSEELGEWCCTLAHAIANVTTTISNMKGL